MNNPSAFRELRNGRSAFWDDATGTVVIRNPSAADGGTAFRPRNGRSYFGRAFLTEKLATAKDVTIRLTCEDIDLLLSALNEALETVDDWEFSTQTGFERSEFRALQEALQVVRNKMTEER